MYLHTMQAETVTIQGMENLTREVAALTVEVRHLDDCMDGLKTKVDNLERRVNDHDRKFDRALYILCTVIVVMTMLAGNGTVSLHTLIQALTK